MDAIVSMTSLPNLHPAVVHFPVALLLTALVFDVATLLVPKRLWLDRSAAALYLLGAITGWGAFWAGNRAADSLVDVPAGAQPYIGDHHDWALRTMWLFTMVALARLGVSWVDRARSAVTGYPVRGVLLAVVLAGQWMLLETADRGGALVYRHALAVSRPEEAPGPQAVTPAQEVPLAEPPESRLRTADDGSMTWNPSPHDAAALDSVLVPVTGAPQTAVRTLPERSHGVALEVSGRSLLVLPGKFENLQVEAELGLAGFHGRVGVAHHVHAFDSASTFEITSDGEAVLASWEGDSRKVLDTSSWEAPEDPITLAVSASGRHFKGMVGGATIVHGHADPTQTGAAGLLLDGDGIVYVYAMRVTRLDRDQ